MATPVIGLSTSSLSLSEGNSGSTAFRFTVTRTGDTSGTSTVNWMVAEGASPAVSASDFVGGSLPSGTLTFTAGVTSQTITVNVQSDTTVESNENFVLTLGTTANATLDASHVFATAVIQNDDTSTPPVIGLSTSSLSLAEGNSGSTPFTFTLTRSGDTSGTSSVNWMVAEGASPAVSASDFVGGSLPSGTATFGSGVTTQTITVNVQGDTTVESSENFVLSLGTTSNATLDASHVFSTAVIQNDDSSSALPVIGLSTTSLSSAEGNNGSTTFAFTVTRSGDASGTSTVNWMVAEGAAPAVNASDFAGGVLPSGTVTFGPGVTTQTISVNVQGDTAVESNENFVLTLGTTSNASLDPTRVFATAIIQNDDSTSGDTVPDTPATANSFLTIDQSKNGTIDSVGQDSLAGDNDVYKVTLSAGHTYTFSANANGNTGDTLDQAYIRIYGPDGNRLSPDLVAGGSATPSFVTPVIPSGGGTYYFAISADGAGTSWKSKTGDYSILVHDNGGTTSGATTLNATAIQTGTTAQEVAAIALANQNMPWASDACTAFIWGVTNLAGLPFFDLSNRTTNSNPTNPQDTAYVVPHSAGKYSGTSDIGGDGWYLVSSNPSVSQLQSVLQPGDVVRVYKAGNTGEDSTSGAAAVAHSFIVVDTSGGNIQVVDNWNGVISKHAFSDISGSWASGGSFAAAFVSRIDANWVASHVNQNTLQGNGYGDWSGLGLAQPPTYSVSASTNPVSESAGTLTFTITRTGTNLPTETVYASTVQNPGYLNNGDYAADLVNLAVPFAAGVQTATVSLAITNDTTPENDETFNFIVQRNISDPISTSLASTTFTIHDDDAGAATTYTIVNATPLVSNRAGTTITFNVTRQGTTPAKTLYLSSGGSEINLSDNNGVFTPLNAAPVVFNDGATSSTTPITITLTGATLVQATENFGVYLREAANATAYLTKSIFSLFTPSTAYAQEVSTVPSIPLPFSYGVNDITVTQAFGDGNHGSGSDFAKLLNYSVDFFLPAGTDVLAEGTGVVKAFRDSIKDADGTGDIVSTDEAAGSHGIGNYITIEYNSGTTNQFCATYIHLKQNSVTASGLFPGATVYAGQPIGDVGHTGVQNSSSGNSIHLHVTYGHTTVPPYADNVVITDGSIANNDGNPVQFSAARSQDTGQLKKSVAYDGDNAGICVDPSIGQSRLIVGSGVQDTFTVANSSGNTVNLSMSAAGNQCLVTNTDTGKPVLSASDFGRAVFNLITGLVVGPLNGTSMLPHTVYFNGTDGDDHLDASATDTSIVASGGAGNDMLIGGPLDDMLSGGGGSNTLNGGAGNDTADYGGALAAVMANLSTGTVSGAGIGPDTLVSIENVIGSAYNDDLVGNADTVLLVGGAGDDYLSIGAALKPASLMDGGSGSDTLELNGDYSAGLLLQSSTIQGIEYILFKSGHSYTLTSANGNVAAGGTLNVNGTALSASDTLRFNGSSETDGAFVFEGGAGHCEFRGSANLDQFMMGASLLPSDVLNGSGGYDWLVLSGDYSSGLTFQPTTIQNIEGIYLAPGNNYRLTENDANLSAGENLQVWTRNTNSSDSVVFDGSNETDGTFFFDCGPGRYTFTGGTGNDEFWFEGTAFNSGDVFDGGAGRDGLVLHGDYSGGVTLNADTLKNVEYVYCQPDFNYQIMMNDGNVASGLSMLVYGPADGHNLRFDGSRETNGGFTIYCGAGADIITGGAEHDTITGGGGNDTLDGGANIDAAVVAGARSAYTITQTSTGVFQVTGPDGADTLTNIEYLRFDDETMRLLPGTGTLANWSVAPSTYMGAIRDFDGNDLGGASSWLLIGAADANGDGANEHILVNRAIGRWAEVATAPDGNIYFEDHGWAGGTRVLGIYIDPLVTQGIVQAGSDFDSQRRFQNDLYIENINGILGQNDYNNDGLQEIYFRLTDGTAYLHAYMHADGNIQYANYQNQQQVIDYLTSNGWSSNAWNGWFAQG